MRKLAAVWRYPVLIAAGCRPGDFWRAGMNVDAYMGKIGSIDKMQTISMQRAGFHASGARHGQGSARNRGRDGARTISGSESVPINGLVRSISVARRQQTLR